MRRTWLAAALLVSLVIPAAGAPSASASDCGPTFSGGTGTSADPYQIATAGDLVALQGDVGCYSSYFEQTADIDLTGASFTSIGSDPDSGGTPFAGSYDGSAKTISALTVPLFGVVEGGAITGVHVAETTISGTSDIGSVAGVLLSGSISDVTSAADVTGIERVGGIVGAIGASGDPDASASVTNATYDGSVTGGSGVGGIAGTVWGNVALTVSGASVSGAVSAPSAESFLGGVIGIIEVGSTAVVVDTSSSSATVTESAGTYGRYTGGLIGAAKRNSSGLVVIESSHATGNVTATKGAVGGLLGGGVARVRISSSDATGDVTVTGTESLGDGIGGLVGSMAQGAGSSITNSHATGTVAVTIADDNALAVANVGGLVGWMEGLSGANAITSSYATGDVTVTAPNVESDVTEVGGFVGTLYSVSVTDSHATGDVVAGGSTGGFAGLIDIYDGPTVVTDCYATGSVTELTGRDVQGNIGGFAGRAMSPVTLTGVHATGSVSGAGNFVGGLLGNVDLTTVTEAYATGTVAGSGQYGYVGGLVGYSSGGVYTRVFATGAASSTAAYVGGLAGYSNGGSFTNAYATGSATGEGHVGGSFGWVVAATMTNVYAAGRVTARTWLAGGVTGESSTDSYTGAYWDTQSTGQGESGDLTGGGSISATGLTSAQMRTSASFADWDFGVLWGYQCSTSIYPQLRWANSEATATACPVPAPDNGGGSGGSPSSPTTSTTEPTAPPTVTAAPEPEPSGAREPGTASMTIGGQPVPVTDTPQRRGEGIVVSAGPLSVSLRSETTRGQSVPTSPDGTLVIARSGTLPTSGGGVAPGSGVTVVLNSDPVHLATVTAAADGTFIADATVPAYVPQGNHTLTLVGTTKDGQPFILAVGVTVTSPASALGASPIVTVTPQRAASGSTITVTARDVQARCTVTFTLGASKARAKASSRGMASTRLRMPSGTPRSLTLRAAVSGKGCAAVSVDRRVARTR